MDPDPVNDLLGKLLNQAKNLNSVLKLLEGADLRDSAAKTLITKLIGLALSKSHEKHKDRLKSFSTAKRIAAELWSIAPWLIFWPNDFLDTFLFQKDDFGGSEFARSWPRVLKAVVLSLAALSYSSSKHKVFGVLRTSVYSKLVVAALFVYFVRREWAQKPLLLFAFVDVMTALWKAAEIKDPGLDLRGKL